MPSSWYLTRGDGVKYGPYSDEQIKEYAASDRISPTDLLWKEGMEQWAPANSIPGFTIAPSIPPPPPVSFSKSSQDGNRIAAGILGILLGWLGIHKFILGLTMPGIIMLLVSILTCGWGAIPMGIIGLVEGILYLSKSDEEFYQIYVVGKKQWF